MNPYANGAAYVGRRFVPIAEATLPVTDWGFTRSDAVYDVVHVFKGGFFRLDDHLDRFMRSIAQNRFTAVGRVAASTLAISSTSLLSAATVVPAEF